MFFDFSLALTINFETFRIDSKMLNRSFGFRLKTYINVFGLTTNNCNVGNAVEGKQVEARNQ